MEVCSLEYSDIPNVFFTPHHVGHCCINVIRGHCCAAGKSYTNAIGDQCCALDHPYTKGSEVIVTQQRVPMIYLHIVAKQRVPTMGHPFPLLRKIDPRSYRLPTLAG
jgi:hypothetical protein